MPKITKVVRLKITQPIYPTSDWKEFNKIMKKLSEEVRIASNKVIAYCNYYYCSEVFGEEHDKEDEKRRSKILYDIAKTNCPSLSAYNCASIENEINKLYFNGNNSYVKKINSGEGNPPMGYKKDGPIPIAEKKYFKIEKIGNYYNFSCNLFSKNYQKEWNENHKESSEQMNDHKIKVGIDCTAKSVRSIVDRCISGEYQMGGSQIVKKDDHYYINLVYIFNLENDIPVNEDKVLGVDLGVNTAATCAVNYNTYSRKYIGGSIIARRKEEYKRLLSEEQRIATVTTKNGHGRKVKSKYPKRIRNKRGNFAETTNRVIAKEIVTYAKKMGCGVIKFEDLSGFRAKYCKDKFLENWTYYQLQNFTEQCALQNNIKIEYVDPKHTSQTCSECGYCDEDNRPKGALGAKYFKCLQCGHSEDADFNAAKNIARKEAIKRKNKNLTDVDE